MPFTRGPPGLELDAGASIAIATQRFPSFARALKIRPWPGPSSYTTHTRHPFHSNDTAKKKKKKKNIIGGIGVLFNWRCWAELGWAGMLVGNGIFFLFFFFRNALMPFDLTRKNSMADADTPSLPPYDTLSAFCRLRLFFFIRCRYFRFMTNITLFRFDRVCLRAVFGSSQQWLYEFFFVVAPHLVLLFEGPHRIGKSNRCSRDFGLFLLFFMRCFRVSVIDFNSSL